MSRKNLGAGALLSPLPAVLVTCGNEEKSNIITIAWTGIICTKPAMLYIAVRPERYSYNIIKEKGEFVVNLTTSKMVRETDLCGVKSGKNVNKFDLSGLHKEKANKVACPIIAESPLSLECVVKQIIPLGSHDMFIAEIVSSSADERYIDSKGKLNLEQAGLMAYTHGNYNALGRKLGDFGFSVKKKAHNAVKGGKSNARK